MIRVGVVLFAGLVSGFPAIAEVATAQADGVVLRTLDKVSGAVIDRTLLQETTTQVGNLAVTLNECRYPLDNPAGDAFARITILSGKKVGPIYQGWMVASSPALNPLDHARYDVWVLRCTIPEAETE
jgi:hypothetical protein